MTTELTFNQHVVIEAANFFNECLKLIPSDDTVGLDAHVVCISEYAENIPDANLREIFMDHCIMPEA